MSSLRTLQSLVERLDAIRDPQQQAEEVCAALGAAAFDASELKPHLNWASDKYTRNLVRRTPLYDLMVLCWQPGQGTPVHDHSGQCGWVRVLRGQIEETSYQPTGEPIVEWQGQPGDEQEVGLRECGTGIVAAGPAVVGVDRKRAIHKLGNPAQAGGERTVTLHLYSRPHDSCLVFDLATQTCRPRELVFDSGSDACIR